MGYLNSFSNLIRIKFFPRFFFPDIDPNITESVRDLVVRALEKGESHDSYGENVTDGRSGILLKIIR